MLDTTMPAAEAAWQGTAAKAAPACAAILVRQCPCPTMRRPSAVWCHHRFATSGRGDYNEGAFEKLTPYNLSQNGHLAGRPIGFWDRRLVQKNRSGCTPG